MSLADKKRTRKRIAAILSDSDSEVESAPAKRQVFFIQHSVAQILIAY